MNVVLYMRYSSDRQTEQSIEGQNRVCENFCRQQGYTIVGKYIDRATSAFKHTDKRTEFQRMIRESDRKLWDGVVVYKLDRFSRNRYDSATYKAKLKKNGVRVISATENISENPEGVILESVLEGMAEFYSMELSQKITRGMYESATKAYNLGGIIPLGYKLENKKLIIDPPGAEIVKEAFTMYANGCSAAEIIETFNIKGYRTSKGSKFNKNSFKSMFRNERYIGVYTYKDIRIEGGVPAIVDKDTWDKVQVRLEKNAKAPARGKAQVDYLLTGKLFCGHCGAAMVGECGTSKSGAKYHYYTCANRKRKGKGEPKCDKKPIGKDLLEYTIVQDVLNMLTPEVIDQLADAAVRAAEKEAEENTVIPALQAEIREIEKKIANLVKVIEQGIVSETISNRIAELEKEKRAVEKRLLDAKDEVVILEKEHIVWWLTKFCDGDIEDATFRRHMIDLLVNSVTLWDEPDGYYKITVMYNIMDGNTKVIPCSDLESKRPPLNANPNTLVIRFPIFPFERLFSTSEKHPAR